MTETSTAAAAAVFPSLGRVAVLVPTYNERQNLPRILQRLRAAVPTVDVVVIDDGSPDGTGALADDLAARDDRLHVLHRAAKEGLGAAYLEGFRWVLDHGYEVVVEMDADGSHQPEQLPPLLRGLESADVVLGSRWVRGGSVVNWPLGRELLSRGANVYVRLLLGMPVGDATGGFRAYRASALRAMDLHDVASQGYCFQVDLVWRAVSRGLTVLEVPIQFVERELGESKMSRDVVQESLLRVTAWGVRRRAGQLTDLVRSARREPTWHRLDR
ncbi:MAG TPA: polyprenol monophosphomannose synthase [Segeticoccus sp.]|jgi:dolichol-phosphate mannosyltransferase|nr:polyprenol monophosphomannose synthase [Segeticoccus sp.]